MSMGIQTINATIPQIEDALRAGRSVAQVSEELQEPKATVYAVQRMLEGEDKLLDPRSIVSVSELVAAASRSPQRRVQNIGVRIGELVAELRGRLAEEFDRKQAAAEVALLEKRLAEAKKRLGVRKVAASPSAPRKAAGGSIPGEFPCRKCGSACKTAAGRGAHERHCTVAGVA